MGMHPAHAQAPMSAPASINAGKRVLQGNHPHKTGARETRPLPMGPSFMVRRTRLLQDLIRQVSNAGIAVLCAPKGFGKTALLIQYVDEVASDPSRGYARLVDAEDAVFAELAVQLEEIMHECAQAVCPALAIDNLPVLSGKDVDDFVDLLRDLRQTGIELVIACTPASGETVQKLGDAVKFGAQQLKVHPREYAEWSNTLSISNALDVYALTQGVPVLIASLQGMTEQALGITQPVEGYVGELYRSVLDELAVTDSDRYKLAATLLLVGEGNFESLSSLGVDSASPAFRRLLREYPLFGADRSAGTFMCLGSEMGARRQLCDAIAREGASLVRRVSRALLRAGRSDRAVALISDYLPPKEAAACVDAFPLMLAMHGHASFVNSVLTYRKELGINTRASIALELAVYTSALTVGDYRLARAVCGELRARVDEVTAPVLRRMWADARLFAKVLTHASGLDLPDVRGSGRQGRSKLGEDYAALAAHERCMKALIEQGEWTGEAEKILERAKEKHLTDDEIDIPFELLRCDVMLAEALKGSMGHIGKEDAELALKDRSLRERKLAPVVSYARLVRSVRRLLAGAPLIDERAFTDAGTAALRASDLPMQLLATILAGWQELVQGQAVNAQFRAQQVLKLATESQPYLRMHAGFLERVSHLCGISRVALREEAGLLDLGKSEVNPAEAWECAFYLSAAQDSAELAAWYSLHKEELLDMEFRLFARLAISVLGKRADAIRRLLPMRLAPYYLLEDSERDSDPLFKLFAEQHPEDIGKISIRLFGGFSVTRNGHILTDTVWRRRKIGVLTARLAIEPGMFVARHAIAKELWPRTEYGKARDNLYCALSTLRHALGQYKDGPQYLLTQGDGVCFNSEFIDSDVAHFNEIAREILLGASHMSSAQLISLCLQAENLYAGPLIIPDKEDLPYFTHMRHSLQSKFIDCMVRGIDVAIEEEDVNSALWMTEAALKGAAGREDVVRRALQVYELAGRYTDVEEVYRLHRDYLLRNENRAPEPETEQVYRQIEGRRLRFGT